MTPDQQNTRSPHDLSTPAGCRAEAERVRQLCIEDGLPPRITGMAWADWMTEARLMEAEADG